MLPWYPYMFRGMPFLPIPIVPISGVDPFIKYEVPMSPPHCNLKFGSSFSPTQAPMQPQFNIPQAAQRYSAA